MAVGKSTVGRLLAQRQGRSFFDLDAEIGDIPAIFAAEGESGFRRREHLALARLCRQDGVLALGGGCLAQAENLPLLRDWRVLVLMDEIAALSLRLGPGRPLAAQMEKLWHARQSSWRQAGPWLWIEGRSPEAVADAVEALWR